MDLKKIFNHLNRRSTRLLPKNKTFTKVVLVLLIGFLITFPIKNALAALNQNIQDATQDEEADYTEKNYTETTKSTTGTGASTKNGGIPMSTAALKEYEEEVDAQDPEKVNQQNWIVSSAIANGIILHRTIIGTDFTQAMASPSWTPGGLIGFTNTTVASLFNPPISGVQYIADSVNTILGKPTYAASTGGTFNKLTGILPIWKICRNAVYILFSIVFVVIGLLIMLRIKISPQATISIQNSIPKIIITLILVTFSYAVVGLIIDLSYLIQALSLSLLIKSDPLGTFQESYISQLLQGTGTVWHLMWKAIFSGIGTGDAITVSLISGAITAIIGLIYFMSAWGLLAFVIGAAILFILILINFGKFFLGCAKAYIILLIKIISAPFEIALGAFPNSKVGFGSWFVQTLAYALVFPICIIYLVFLNIIINAVSWNSIWVPGFIQSNTQGVNIIAALLGICGIMILGKLPDLIPEAIFQIKPSPFGKAIGEGFTNNALVKRVQGGFNFVTEQKLGNAIYGGTQKAADRRDAIKSKIGEAWTSRKHSKIKQTNTPFNQGGDNQLDENNTNDTTF